MNNNVPLQPQNICSLHIYQIEEKKKYNNIHIYVVYVHTLHTNVVIKLSFVSSPVTSGIHFYSLCLRLISLAGAQDV